MSLTSILKDRDNQELRDKFKSEFAHPKCKLTGEIKAPPLTANYGIVGTAFDYLLRFHLERLNKGKIENFEWVANKGIAYINTKIIDSENEEIVTGFNKDKILNQERMLVMAHAGYLSAKINHGEFLKNGNITSRFIEDIIFLAKLDFVARNRGVSWAFDQIFDDANPNDIEDLLKLFSIIDNRHFIAEKRCCLNPTFGEGSLIVGGADADLIIDNTLIDIKVTKELKLVRKDLNQVLGYYILSLIDKANKYKQIEFVGIYFARHGILWKEPISTFGDAKKIEHFKEWFISFQNGKVKVNELEIR